MQNKNTSHMLTLKTYTDTAPIHRGPGGVSVFAISQRATETVNHLIVRDTELEAAAAFEGWASDELSAGSTIASPHGHRWFLRTSPNRDPSPSIDREIDRYEWNQTGSRVRATVYLVAIDPSNQINATPIRSTWIKF